MNYSLHSPGTLPPAFAHGTRLAARIPDQQVRLPRAPHPLHRRQRHHPRLGCQTAPARDYPAVLVGHRQFHRLRWLSAVLGRAAHLAGESPV